MNSPEVNNDYRPTVIDLVVVLFALLSLMLWWLLPSALLWLYRLAGEHGLSMTRLRLFLPLIVGLLACVHVYSVAMIIARVLSFRRVRGMAAGKYVLLLVSICLAFALARYTARVNGIGYEYCLGVQSKINGRMHLDVLEKELKFASSCTRVGEL
jgi:hypothetical protein